METFRQLMAFPLYATVLWLLHVFSRQTSTDAMWRLAIALLVLAMAGWAWGIAQRRGRARILRGVVAPAIAVAALALGLSAVHDRGAAAGTEEARADGFWQPWSPERVEQLRSAGHPVFVNFTADWCLSCQVNARVVFASRDVRDLFRTNDVVALKADWTNEDARIAETLASFGRDGVPLYVFYPAGGGPPRVLPQVPTSRVLAETFAGAQASRQAEFAQEKQRS